MIVLGFTAAERPLPASLSLQKRDQVYLICAPKSRAITPRDRLALLVQCFDAGIDVLPLPPAKAVCADQFGASCQTDGIQAHLHRLTSTGQLTVKVTVPAPNRISDGTGRGWLAARQAGNAQTKEICVACEKLASDCGVSEWHVRHRQQDVTFDFLVVRSAEVATKERLRQKIKKAKQLNQLPVTITGLWPPFSFASVNQEQGNAA